MMKRQLRHITLSACIGIPLCALLLGHARVRHADAVPGAGVSAVGPAKTFPTSDAPGRVQAQAVAVNHRIDYQPAAGVRRNMDPLQSLCVKCPLDDARASASADAGSNGSETPFPAGDYRIGYYEDAACFQSVNVLHNLAVRYYADGFAITPCSATFGGWDLRLRLIAIDKGGVALHAGSRLVEGMVSAGENRLEITQQGFRIEYLNSSEGVRQNFIVEQRPEGDDLLRVRLRVDGNLIPVVTGEDDALFVSADHRFIGDAIGYRGLKVWDACGRELDARMEVTGDDLVLAVNDNGATYPVTVDPLAGVPIRQLSEADWSVGTGVARFVSGAGDVNGDGHDEVIVSGSYGILLFYGSAAGLATSPGWTIADDATLDVGQGVGIGDVNGDGYDDIAITGWSPSGEGSNGRTYIVHGAAAGLSSISDTIPGAGASMASAGDVNGDGYGDLVVGYSGSVSVYFGSAAGLSDTANWRHSDGPSGSYYGSSVASAGDVNGDGYDEVIVGARYYHSSFRWDEGAVYMYYGSPSGPGSSYNWMVKGNGTGANFGASVAGVGDWDGDGYDDVLGGRPGTFSDRDYGSAWGFSGAAGGALTTTSFIGSAGGSGYYGLNGDQYGEVVSGAGDFNGDGYSDFMVGAPSYYLYGINQEPGGVFVYFGGSGHSTVSRNFIILSDTNSDRLGWSIAGAGDVNGDGYDEIIVAERSGRAFVFYGSPDSVPGHLTGGVVDDSGDPIAGASVNLDGGTPVITDSDGAFAFAATVGAGYHVLHVTAAGFSGADFDLTMPATDKHVVLGLNPVDIPPPQSPFMVCGTVTSTNGSGAPLENVTVELLQSGGVLQTMTTDADGEFCSASFAAGTYQIRFSKSGYQTQTADLLLDVDRQIVASLLPGGLE